MHINLTISGSKLSLILGHEGGQILSGLPREVCPSCNSESCVFSCDGSQGAADNTNQEDEDDVAGRLKYNGFLDAIESLALAHACAGLDVSDERYVAGLETALNAAGNHL